MGSMLHRLAADAVLVAHFAFIAYVVLGGLIVVRWPKTVFLHLPAAAWGAFVELSGRGCPLTHWENVLRLRAGESGYGESFVEHYVLPLVYPGELTRTHQLWLAALVVAINVAIYAWALRRRRARRRP